jgi:Zn-finger nucleic acid-binding protein
MKCPTCPDATLVMTDRQGIEIDYCPQCRGVWLDRGELDKIIERGGAQTAPQRAAPPAQPPQQHYPQATRHPDFEDSDFKRRSPYGYRKPKSWLSDIFD